MLPQDTLKSVSCGSITSLLIFVRIGFEPNVTNGIRTTVATRKTARGQLDRTKNPDMTFEIKIQNMRHLSTWLCSVTIAQILQIINGI